MGILLILSDWNLVRRRESTTSPKILRYEPISILENQIRIAASAKVSYLNIGAQIIKLLVWGKVYFRRRDSETGVSEAPRALCGGKNRIKKDAVSRNEARLKIFQNLI